MTDVLETIKIDGEDVRVPAGTLKRYSVITAGGNVYAVSIGQPKFCLLASSREDADIRAKAALKFYDEHKSHVWEA